MGIEAIFGENWELAGIFCIGYDITELTKLTSELQLVKEDHYHSVRLQVANILGLAKL